MKRKTPLRSKTPLKKRSNSQKKKANQRRYETARANYIKENPRCEFGECQKIADDIHHMRGRNGKNLYDPSGFMSVCRLHHNWIHGNVAAAREMGYLIYDSRRFR